MTDFQAVFALRLAPMRLRFGTPAAEAVAEELAALGSVRAVVLCTASQGAAGHAFAARVGARVAGVFAGAVMHTPTGVTARAVDHVRALAADAVVALGGGSTIGLGKAIALHTGLPQIAVPTTYAGSEATAILGQTEMGQTEMGPVGAGQNGAGHTEAGRKVTITDPRVQPAVIVYDPALVASLPVPLTVTSGLNAVAHAAEALYARDRNPLTTALAVQGLQAMIAGLPAVVAAPGDLAARGRTQYGAFLCGMVLGQVGMSLHHKLCHVLGGSFGLPHAETHAVILPHALAYNAAAAGDLLAPLNALLGPGGMQGFAQALGAPTALRDLGLAEGDLDRAADLAVQAPYWSPRAIDRDALRGLLQRAWAGAAAE